MSQVTVFAAEERSRRPVGWKVWAVVLSVSVIVGGTATGTVALWSRRRAAEQEARELREQAEGMVRDMLMAPSTAKFPATRLLEQGPGRYLYFVPVDAQNSFGVYLREHYCVTFFVREDGTAYWHKKYGVQTCRKTPEDSPIDLIKSLNSWENNLTRVMP